MDIHYRWDMEWVVITRYNMCNAQAPILMPFIVLTMTLHLGLDLPAESLYFVIFADMLPISPADAVPSIRYQLFRRVSISVLGS